MTHLMRNNQDDFIKFKNDVVILKDMVDVSFLVEHLGFQIFNETTKELRGACLIHGGDNKISFRMNKETGTWSCFSHKCHDTYGGDVIGLVRACKGLDFMGAVNFLKEFTGFSTMDKGAFFKSQREHEKRQFIKKSTESTSPILPNSKFINEEVLKKYKDFGPSLIHKSFSKETVSFFEMGGGHVAKNGLSQDIIPIRGIDNELVGVSYRDIRENIQIDDKYRTFVNKDRVLYNLNNAKDFCKYNPLIVVEGFKDVWRLYEHGIKNCVCIMGSEITPGQCALLYSYAHKGVVLMLDNDAAGISGMSHAYANLIRRVPVKIVMITEVDSDGKGLDPADLNEAQLKSYLNGYF